MISRTRFRSWSSIAPHAIILVWEVAATGRGSCVEPVHGARTTRVIQDTTQNEENVLVVLRVTCNQLHTQTSSRGHATTTSAVQSAMFQSHKCEVAPGCHLIVRLHAIAPNQPDGRPVVYLDAAPTMAYAEVTGCVYEREFPLHMTTSAIDDEVKQKAYEHAGFMLRPQGMELIPFDKLAWSQAR